MAENPRIEELRRRVQADPASIAFAALAEEFRRVGRFEDAIETCRTGLQRHPAYLSARVTLGRALIEVGEYDAAREELETVLRSAPENLAATRGLAQINERLGHSTEMHPDLHEIVREPIRLAALNPPPTPPAPSLAPPPTDATEARPSFARSFVSPAPDVTEAAGAASNAAEVIPPLDNATADKGAEAWSAFEFAPPPEPASTAGLESLDISLQSEDVDASEAETPVDIFAAALNRPEPPIAPPMTFETGTIAFEAPVLPPSPVLSAAPEGTPDAHIAATLVRLERFLGAIQSARHA